MRIRVRERLRLRVRVRARVGVRVRVRVGVKHAAVRLIAGCVAGRVCPKVRLKRVSSRPSLGFLTEAGLSASPGFKPYVAYRRSAP